MNIPLRANKIEIKAITIRTSDLYIKYDFFIFEEQYSEEFPDERDTFFSKSCSGRRITYLKPRPSTYEDLDGCKHLHCGIALHERLTRFNMNNQEFNEYLQSPVGFNVTLKYTIPS